MYVIQALLQEDGRWRQENSEPGVCIPVSPDKMDSASNTAGGEV